MAINQVVGSVELALSEPAVIAGLQRAAVDSLEIAIPGDELASMAAPKLGGLCDGLLVQGLVLFEA